VVEVATVKKKRPKSKAPAPIKPVGSTWWIPRKAPSALRNVRALQTDTLFTFSDDYRSITYRGQPYTLTSNRATIIRLLHAPHKQGRPAVHCSTLLKAVESETSEVRSFFRGSPLWGTLIVKGPDKGTYQLNLSYPEP
jgi:hypothetical protein